MSVRNCNGKSVNCLFIVFVIIALKITSFRLEVFTQDCTGLTNTLHKGTIDYNCSEHGPGTCRNEMQLIPKGSHHSQQLG